MNKLLFLALVVLVTGVVVSAKIHDEDWQDDDEKMTQFAVFADDDTETAKLTDEKLVFRDFCLEARDEVRAFLKSASHAKASTVFTLIGEVFTSATKKAGDEGAKAVEQGNSMIVADASKGKSALGLISSTFLRVATGEFNERIAEVKAQLNGENVVGAIQDACNAVARDLMPSIQSSFASCKKETLDTSAAGDFINLNVIKATTLANLGCLTTARLTLVSRGCQIMGALLPTLRSFVN